MPRRILLAFSCALAVTLAVLAVPAAGAATTVPTPSKFTKVSAVAGPLAGEVTVSWKHSGKNTTSYELETALSLFSKSSTSSLPRVGRHAGVFTVKANQRSLDPDRGAGPRSRARAPDPEFTSSTGSPRSTTPQPATPSAATPTSQAVRPEARRRR